MKLGTKKRDDAVKRMFEAGVKGREIAAKLGLSESCTWKVITRMGLEHRRSVPVNGKKLSHYEVYARRFGRVAYDEADLPGGGCGWIAFLGDWPGETRETKLEALQSAVAIVGGVT